MSRILGLEIVFNSGFHPLEWTKINKKLII